MLLSAVACESCTLLAVKQVSPPHVFEDVLLGLYMQFSKLDEALFLKVRRLEELWNLRVGILKETGGASSFKCLARSELLMYAERTCCQKMIRDMLRDSLAVQVQYCTREHLW